MYVISPLMLLLLLMIFGFESFAFKRVFVNLAETLKACRKKQKARDRRSTQGGLGTVHK